MGCQLLRRGVPVKGIILIDSPCPVNHIPLSDALIDLVIRQDEPKANTSTTATTARLVKSQFRASADLLGRYKPSLGSGPLPRVVLLRSREGYNPAEVAEVPKWLAERGNTTDVVDEWRSLVGAEVKVWDIPGNHFNPFHTANVSISPFTMSSSENKCHSV